jgi:ankyrin repeat protein
MADARLFFEGCRTGSLSKVTKYLEAGGSIEARDSEGLGGLHLASRHGQVEVVRLLQARGADLFAFSQPRLPSADSVTGMHLAAEQGTVEGIKIVQLFVSAGVDLNTPSARGWQVSHFAVLGKRADMLDWLYFQNKGYSLERRTHPSDHTGDPSTCGVTPLLLACIKGSPACMQRLVEWGADLQVTDANGWTMVHWACVNDSHQILITIMNAKMFSEFRTFLYTAVATTPRVIACAEKLKAYLRVLAPLDLNPLPSPSPSPSPSFLTARRPSQPNNPLRRSSTALVHEHFDDTPEVPPAAKREQRASLIEDTLKTAVGWSPLHICASFRSPNCVSILTTMPWRLNAGVCQLDDGWTPSHTAAYHGHHEILEKLLSAGADLQARTHETISIQHPTRGEVVMVAGSTPLHAAAALFHSLTIIRLEDWGVDMSARDQEGQTFADLLSRTQLEALAAKRSRLTPTPGATGPGTGRPVSRQRTIPLPVSAHTTV